VSAMNPMWKVYKSKVMKTLNPDMDEEPVEEVNPRTTAEGNMVVRYETYLGLYIQDLYNEFELHIKTQIASFWITAF